jgi:hypothetical protein
MRALDSLAGFMRALDSLVVPFARRDKSRVWNVSKQKWNLC